MTDLAQGVAVKPTVYRAFDSTPDQDPGKLPLNTSSGNQAKIEVYVYTFPGSIAGFALTSDASKFYTGGLEWQCGVTAFFVEFVYLQDTTSFANDIDCDLPYSVGYVNAQSESRQVLCLPSVEYDAEYSFTVSFSDSSTYEDPKIVITPIVNA